MQTKKITTPINKIEVEIKEWITGTEYEDIQQPITDVKLKIEALGVNKKVTGEVNAGEASRKSDDIAIKVVVVSISGKKESILEKVKAMHKDDYLFILNEVYKIVKGENFTTP